ncbi:MAG: hypothetical protein JWO80_3297 [Bryobacterales bacterium]|nr:hypothetical protein [Bryobacterales bacterium]
MNPIFGQLTNKSRRSFRLAGLLLSAAAAVYAAGASELWRFDNIAEIGGHRTTVLGHPRVIATPAGKAVQFDGVDDALFLDTHPLAGADTFTWEAIFRPEAGGPEEQRFFHFQKIDPQTGRDTQTRMLFETRVIGDQWCLDSFALTGKDSKTLLDRGKLHPLGAWYDVAAVYDGREFRNYVDGVLQGHAELHLAPQGAGHCSIGTRIDKRNYFKGAILQARMTRRALAPSEFLKAPK